MKMKLYINSELEISRYSFADSRVRKDIRLAVLADLHNCMCEDGGRKLFSIIDGEKPDAVLFAGDMIDALEDADPFPAFEFFRLLHSHYPVIYGMGNHERKILEGYRMERERRIVKTGLKSSGLKILSNSYKYLGDTGIKVSCLDLPLSYFSRFEHPELKEKQIIESLGEIDRSVYNIMIAHDPQFFETYSDYGPDLVLSGHMHGGVIRLPYLGGLVSPKLKLFPKYDAGLFKRKGSTMIVSRGLGMHSILVRVNNPTELVILDIKKKDGKAPS
ncbi:MAG: metallophosphoesterase [Lachnospiraceae bacterium]|nr:metallophosphoesterase [Lachnospiraceae bacterium]